MLELAAYINTSGRPSRRERSERRDIDVHGAEVLYNSVRRPYKSI